MQRFLIVDDHAIIRHGIINLIQSRYAGSICFEARDAQECMAIIKSEKFDLVILDVNMPNTNVLDLVEWMKIRDQAVKILILTMHPAAQYAGKYYKKGVMGYITKGERSDEILNAISLILMGRMYIAPEFHDILMDSLSPVQKSLSIASLSDREFAVAQTLAQGHSYQQIAAILNIEVNTVHAFKARIFKKMKVKTLFEFLNLFHSELGVQ